MAVAKRQHMQMHFGLTYVSGGTIAIEFQESSSKKMNQCSRIISDPHGDRRETHRTPSHKGDGPISLCMLRATSMKARNAAGICRRIG